MYVKWLQNNESLVIGAGAKISGHQGISSFSFLFFLIFFFQSLALAAQSGQYLKTPLFCRVSRLCKAIWSEIIPQEGGKMKSDHIIHIIVHVVTVLFKDLTLQLCFAFCQKHASFLPSCSPFFLEAWFRGAPGGGVSG